MYFIMLQLISIYFNTLNLITVIHFIILMIIYTDGSGKTGRYCYLLENLGKKTVQIFEKSGITNNEAEYLAIIEALKVITDGELCIYSDSKLVVNQLNHDYSIKEDRLRLLAKEIWDLSSHLYVKFIWIPREKNKAGKILG